MRRYSDRYFRQRASTRGFTVNKWDRSTGVECPRLDCEKIVVYNGNYFCECGWAAPEYHKCSEEQQAYLDKLHEGLNEMEKV